MNLALRLDVINVLYECTDFLDNYVDVNDGDDGQPVPNKAMSLHQEIESLIARLEAEKLNQ